LVQEEFYQEEKGSEKRQQQQQGQQKLVHLQNLTLDIKENWKALNRENSTST
jgi:hypothetical protein